MPDPAPGAVVRRVAVLFNPASGVGDPVQRLALIRRVAAEHGVEALVWETDPDLGAVELARRAVKEGVERVIVCGGDGSVAEAAGELAGTDVSLAVVPGGTGNLLALNVGVPSDGEQAMRLALTGEPLPCDVGRANGQAFLVMAGMGADARMVKDADREAKRKFGPLAYFIAAWRHLRRPRPLFRITIDGEVLRRHAMSVLVANLGRVTAGVELVTGTAPEDGTLRVAILRARGVWDAVRVAWRAILGRQRSDSLMEMYRGRHIVVECRRPQPVEIDGNELEATSRVEVTVQPGALSLVRPPEAPQPVPAAISALADANRSPLIAFVTAALKRLGARR